jgi:hypothetical protein
MGLVFAVQASVGSIVSALAWVVGGFSEAGSAIIAATLAVLPNAGLFWLMNRAPSTWAPIVLLAGKLASLVVSVVGLVWWSQAWSAFQWPWALVGLSVVVVAWLFAPALVARSERRAADKKIDEIVARCDGSSRN